MIGPALYFINMKIKFIKRQDIINLFLDRVNEGYELTQEEKEFLIDLAK